MKTLHLIFFSCAAFLTILTLGGCNTMEGFGEDLQKLGEKISDKAE